jgi:hypothetical protein
LFFVDASSAHQTLREVQHMTNGKGSEQGSETSTSDEDDDSESSVADDSTEEIISLPNSLASAATLKSKSKSTNKDKLQQSKQSSSNAAKTRSHEAISKPLCSKQLFPSNSDGREEIMVLLKSLVSTNKDLSKDTKQVLREIKQSSLLVEKVDAKVNLLFENQKKIQRVLAKRKVREYS